MSVYLPPPVPRPPLFTVLYSIITVGVQYNIIFDCASPWIARAKYQRTVTPTRFALQLKSQQGYHHEVNRRLPSGTTGRLEAVEM